MYTILCAALARCQVSNFVGVNSGRIRTDVLFRAELKRFSSAGVFCLPRF